jgi:hypothetical protein
MELDNEIKEQAIAFAKQTIENIKNAHKDPLSKLNEEEVKIYEELKNFGFFDFYPILSGEWDQLYLLIIATGKYKTLKYLKDNPPQPKPSKWEFVMGKMGKPNRKNK